MSGKRHAENDQDFWSLLEPFIGPVDDLTRILLVQFHFTTFSNFKGICSDDELVELFKDIDQYLHAMRETHAGFKELKAAVPNFSSNGRLKLSTKSAVRSIYATVKSMDYNQFVEGPSHKRTRVKHETSRCDSPVPTPSQTPGRPSIASAQDPHLLHNIEGRWDKSITGLIRKYHNKDYPGASYDILPVDMENWPRKWSLKCPLPHCHSEITIYAYKRSKDNVEVIEMKGDNFREHLRGRHGNTSEESSNQGEEVLFKIDPFDGV